MPLATSTWTPNDNCDFGVQVRYSGGNRTLASSAAPRSQIRNWPLTLRVFYDWRPNSPLSYALEFRTIIHPRIRSASTPILACERRSSHGKDTTLFGKPIREWFGTSLHGLASTSASSKLMILVLRWLFLALTIGIATGALVYADSQR